MGAALVTAIFDPDDLKADLQEIFDAKGEYANYEPQVARQKKAHEIAEVLHEHTKKVVVKCTGKNSSGTLIYLEGNIR